MVEKIIVNPESIRAYGNVLMSKSASDWVRSDAILTKTTDTVYGATTDVFKLQRYALSFDSESYTSDGNLTVYVTVLNEEGMGVAGETVTVTGCGGTGTGTTNSNGVATINVTGITESGNLTAKCGGSEATALVTYEPSSYSLAFSQDTYTIDFLDVTVSCTLKNGGVAMSGETVTFGYANMLGPQSVTATTNSSGVATYTFNDTDFNDFPATVTATYDTASASCTIEYGGF